MTRTFPPVARCHQLAKRETWFFEKKGTKETKKFFSRRSYCHLDVTSLSKLSSKGARFDSPGRSPRLRDDNQRSAPTGRNSCDSQNKSRPVGASILSRISDPGLRPGLSNLSPLGPRTEYPLRYISLRYLRCLLFISIPFILASGCRERAKSPALPVASIKHWSFPPDGIKAPAPRAVAVSPNGDVFVLDNAARVLVFDGGGNFLRLWRMPDAGLGNPQGVRVLRDGRVVVADTHYSRLVFFDVEGKELGRLGEFGKEQGQFIYPTVVAQDDAENIYVGEYGDHDRIQKFAKDGTFLLEFGSFGTEPGQFQRPSGIVWHAGRIFVADAFNNRIQVFADDGRFLGILSDEKSPVELNYPYDLVLDSRGGTSDPNFLLVEYGGNCVTQLSSTGRLLGRYGSEGSDIGQFVTPWRLAIHPQTGSVIVMDTGNRRIVELK